jgi:hypothetical protein
MLKLIRFTFVALTLAAASGFVATPAGAVGYEDSLDDCAYPAGFDALVMRPLSFVTMVAGAAALVPITLTLIVPAALNTDYPRFAADMVVPAAKFTFARPLGECASVSAGY